MIKKIWNGVTTALVIAVVLMAVLLVGCRLLGWQVYTVLSGSMEPNYHVGSIIYVVPTDPGELKVDDAISFLIGDNTVATHRIVEVIPDETDPSVIRFRTKGDANDDPDEALVHCKNVLGKVVGTIPLLGYVSDFVQKPPGFYITMAATAILVLAVFLPDILAPAKPQEVTPALDAAVADNEKLKAELETLKQKIQQQEQQREYKKEECNNEKDV